MLRFDCALKQAAAPGYIPARRFLLWGQLHRTSFFGERKYPKNAARNRVVSGHPPRATHILDCWGVCHTVVGFCKGPKDRIGSALAPQPLTVRNVGVCGSFFRAVGGRPERKEYDPYISKHQRQRRRGKVDSTSRPRPAAPLLVDRKGSQETMGFLRSFGYFLCAQKVPRRRKNTPIP